MVAWLELRLCCASILIDSIGQDRQLAEKVEQPSTIGVILTVLETHNYTMAVRVLVACRAGNLGIRVAAVSRGRMAWLKCFKPLAFLSLYVRGVGNGPSLEGVKFESWIFSVLWKSSSKLSIRMAISRLRNTPLQNCADVRQP